MPNNDRLIDVTANFQVITPLSSRLRDVLLALEQLAGGGGAVGDGPFSIGDLIFTADFKGYLYGDYVYDPGYNFQSATEIDSNSLGAGAQTAMIAPGIAFTCGHLDNDPGSSSVKSGESELAVFLSGKRDGVFNGNSSGASNGFGQALAVDPDMTVLYNFGGVTSASNGVFVYPGEFNKADLAALHSSDELTGGGTGVTWEAVTLVGAPSADRSYASACVMPDGKLFVFGGLTAGGVVNDGGVYDPDTDAWLSKPNLAAGTGAPAARHTAQAWPISDDEVLVFGGDAGGYNNREAFSKGDLPTGSVYNILTDTWSSPANLDSPPFAGPYGVVYYEDGYLYVVNNAGSPHSAARYNVSTDTWDQPAGLHPMPAGFDGIEKYGSGGGGGYIVLFGGETGSNNEVSDIAIYDIAQDTWTHVSNPNLITPNWNTLPNGTTARVWSAVQHMGNGIFLVDTGAAIGGTWSVEAHFVLDAKVPEIIGGATTSTDQFHTVYAYRRVNSS